VVGIYVGTTLIGKVNLYLSVTRYQQFLFLPKFSYRYGTVVIRSLTARKLVQVDGLVVIRT
jgi:subtilase family serine protease